MKGLIPSVYSLSPQCDAAVTQFKDAICADCALAGVNIRAGTMRKVKALNEDRAFLSCIYIVYSTN